MTCKLWCGITTGERAPEWKRPAPLAKHVSVEMNWIHFLSLAGAELDPQLIHINVEEYCMGYHD